MKNNDLVHIELSYQDRVGDHASFRKDVERGSCQLSIDGFQIVLTPDDLLVYRGRPIHTAFGGAEPNLLLKVPRRTNEACN